MGNGFSELMFLVFWALPQIEAFSESFIVISVLCLFKVKVRLFDQQVLSVNLIRFG
jgi:hypothetical protein